uniref:Uncharacterized protein n=1 Tax=Ciona savignyi TaxID=51511 RepID=H2YSC1_CIOSA
MTGLFTNDKLVTDMGLVASEKSELWSKSLQLAFDDWNKSEKFPVTTQEDLLKLVDLLSLACEMDQAHGVRITQSVRRIDIRTVYVSNAHAHALACMSRLADGLDHLTLIVADIRPLIISSLFHAKNKIKHVDLSFNLQLALDGNCELSKVFLVQNLKSVNLRQSELTAEPIKCIAAALCRRVDEIEVLDLSGNPIGNYGIHPIFDCLHKITGHLHLEKARMDLNGGRQDLVVDFQMLQYKLNKLCFTSSEKLKVHIGFDLTKQPNCEDY